jgi:pimeloyl-ACP methyl ester carboxylesterase
VPVVSTPQGPLYYALCRAPQERCRRAPERPPIVLIHGAGGDHLLWPAALRRAADRRVYALDLPGHGRAGGLACRTVEENAQAVAGFLRAEGVGPAVLVGHSMGGAVGLAVALGDPGCVAALVLIASAAQLPASAALLARLERDFEGALELIARTAWAPGAPAALVERGRQALCAAGPQTLLADLRACQRFDVGGRLAEIRVPCLVVAGEADRIVPLDASARLAAGLAHSRFTVISGGGHMLSLEQPEQVAAAVRAFVSEL